MQEGFEWVRPDMAKEQLDYMEKRKVQMNPDLPKIDQKHNSISHHQGQ